MKHFASAFWLSLLLFVPRTGWSDLVISVQIDGNSRLMLQRDQLSWSRLSSDRPVSPTTLNGVRWNPQWPSNSATASLPLKVSAAFAGVISVNQQEGRGSVSVFQQPTAANNFTLILDFNDSAFAGAETYSVNVHGVTFSVGGAPQQVVLVPTGSVWRYLDNGSEQFDWQNPGFDDSSWASGRAQLGYGDGDEATIVSFGTNPNFKFVTTYFRRVFTVENPRTFMNLTVRLLRDDGGVVYLNGIEIFRSNMPFGFIDSTTLASFTIPNSDESVFFSTNTDPALLAGTNVIAVEIHQAARNSSDISFDLELSGSLPTGPPILLQHPRPQTVAPGGTAAFSARAAGPPPLRYQWYFDGMAIQGETNATLIATDVMAGDEGTLSVSVDNPFGSAQSAEAELSVVTLTGDLFQITALSTNHAFATESSAVTGDDRGGIAATFNDLYVTGDAGTARFYLSDLSDAAGVGQFHESLVSDLKSGRVYVLAIGDLPATFGSIDSLLEIDPVRGTLTTNAIRLASRVDMNGCYGCMGIYSGFGRIVLHNSSRAFAIQLPSGVVQDLGSMPAPQHVFSETWAYWGVAEFFGDATWLVCVRDYRTISRTRVPDGLTANVGTFDNLSEMASITVSPVLNRWYFNHQYNSQFRSGYETIGFADASLAHELQSQPPAILVPPQDRIVHEGSNATFTVAALGHPLSYQWQFKAQAIAGATNQSLILTGVTAASLGLYSVVVFNALGGATSNPALLNVVTGQSSLSAVAVLGAEINANWNDDVRQKLLETDLFEQVDAFQVASGFPVPSLQQLQQYDAVLAYSDNGFNDPASLGNVLADYVDGGGGVVLATFVFSGQLAGRIAFDGYLPFNDAGSTASAGLTLVADDATHLILEGVGSFNGGTSGYHNAPLSLASGATQVAHWSDGQPLIGVKPAGSASVVGLNFFPPSSSARGDFWDAHTDGGLLMANALLYAGGRRGITVPSVPPGIRTQPVGITILQGLDAKLTVSAFGSPLLAYQWQFNEAPIASATNASFIVTDARTNQAGGYRVVVTNLYGAVTSLVATLTVQPTRGLAGYYTDFNISSTGLVQAVLSARFTPRRIENINAFDLSRLSVLLINEPSDHPSADLRNRLPDIQDWINRGGRLVVHQPYLNTEARLANPLLPGVRDTVFTNFNDFGSDINLIPPGNTLVTAGPHGSLNNLSLDGEFSPGTFAIGSTLPAGGAAILGAGPNTNRVLAFAYGLGAGLVYFSTLPLDYYLEAGNSPVALNLRNIYAPNVIEYAAGYVPSGPPRIFGGPNDAVATVGGTATFFVSARGQAPLRFQWLHNGNPLAGATNNPLQITDLSIGDAGLYAIIVSNDLNSALSRDAVLKVVPRVDVGIFSDPQFVVTQPGSPANSADNVRASLDQLGHVPRPLTNLLAAVTNSILLFPELINNPLSPFLDEESRALLQAYVLQGGLLISASANYNNIEFLNSVFSFSLSTPGSITGIEFIRTPQALETPFTNGPPRLFGNYNTYPVYTSALPPGTRSLYENTGFAASAAAWIPHGAGAVLVLGWNWYDAAPLGTQDNGWLETLGNALQARGMTTPTPLIQVPLVPPGSTWRYRDNGSDQGTAWRDLNFDDSSWAAGPAQLGYGNGGEATRVSYGPDANNKYVTTYFRRTFNVANAAATSNLMLRLLRDDGAAVYLNGVEIVRDCLGGNASFDTFAFCDITGSDEDRFLNYPVNSELLRAGTNVLAVEIHQYSQANPDISFNLELTGFAPAPAPIIRTQPVGKTVPAGSTVVLNVVAAGALPMLYQWRLEGQNLPGATNAILILDNILVNQSGNYSVLVSNPLGMAISSNALVRAVTLAGDTFRIASLSSNNVFVMDQYELTGDGGGTIAASDQEVLCSGNVDTARFSLADLSGGTNLHQIYQAMVSDLKTETLYLLSSDNAPVTFEGGAVDRLLELNSSTGSLTGRSIPLSKTINLKSASNRFGDVGIFAGFGRIALHDGKHAWTIEVPSGLVVELGPMTVPVHVYAQNWAYWGVAEYFDGALWLVYVRDAQTIVRRRVPDGFTETVARFDDLGNMPSITMSLPLNRWYFHQDSSSQFSLFYQTIGCADAAFISSAQPIPPGILKGPANQTIAASANTSFHVIARGTGPLRYQWLFNGIALPGATNATLTLAHVGTNDSGAYSVLVSNSLDHALSPAATLTVVPLAGETFRIAGLSDQAVVVDDYVVAGYDRGAIAVSGQRAFYSGNLGTARFDLADLSHGTNPGVLLDGLVSDLRTETVYALANGSNLISYGGIVTALLEVDGLTGSLTGASLPLSEPINLGNRYGEIGLFAGVGRIVLTDGSEAWTIDTANGRVLKLGSVVVPAHNYTEIGLYWGVTEFFDDSLWLVYVRDFAIVRTRIPDGFTQVITWFANLSDMAAITVSIPFNRWIFHHQYGSQFSDFYGTLGFAGADFLTSLPPILPGIVKSPLDQGAGAGGTVQFSVMARGTGPLHYQWRFESMPIEGATNSVLLLTNVQPGAAGHYSVVVNNAAGQATSAAALLRIVPGVTLAMFYDPAFILTNSPAPAHLQASLKRLGHQAALFTDITQAASGNAPLLFPGQEAGDLAFALTPSIRNGLQSFVGRGGTMIVMGTVADYTRPARFLNAVFDYSLQPAWSYLPASRTAQAAGTAFEVDPETIPANDFTIGFDSSLLPPGSRRIYTEPGGSTTVLWMPHGSGRILFLGWNWNDAVPLGRQDGGWLSVLESAIEETLTSVGRAPELLVQPENKAVVVGSAARFSVAGTGSPFTYQWLFKGQPLAGATNYVLQLNNVTTNAAGFYSVVLSNAFGSTASSNALLTVVPPVTVGVFDDPQFVNTAGTNFSSSGNILASLAQLGHRVQAITNLTTALTNQVLVFPPLDQGGDLASTLDEPTRAALQTFVQQGGLVICHGYYNNIYFMNSIFGFSVQIYGFGDGPFPRTTQAQGTPFANGPLSLPYNNSTLELSSASLPLLGSLNLYSSQDPDLFSAVALLQFGNGNVIYLGWNWQYAIPAGSQDSGWVDTLGNAVLTRVLPSIRTPVIRIDPQDYNVLAGVDVSFSVGGYGSPSPQVQWFHNTQPIPGATNSLLSLTAVTTAQSGGYHAILSNPSGSVTSRVATLVVRPSRGLAGYLQTCCGYSTLPLAAAVEQAGFASLEIQDISAFDLSRLSLLLLVVDTGNRSSAIFNRLPAIQAWVNNGGRLIVHDWYASTDAGPNPFLFAAPGAVLVQSYNENIQILPPGNNLLVAGPFGMLDNGSLDNAGTSSHGYARRGTLPPRALSILGAGPDTNAVVAFSYGLGAGSIYYAAMPLDHHLSLGGTLGDTIRNVYVPNLIEHAAAYAVSGPPLLLDGPHDGGGLAGGTVTLAVGVNGQTPLNYQWIFNGALIPTATNASLVLAPISSAQAGSYRVIVGNSLGTITSAVAVVTVVQATPFRITALTSNSSQIVDHESITGDDRGGIAVSATHVYYTGDNATGRFSATNLLDGTALSRRYDSLVGDLRSEAIYTLVGGSNLVDGSSVTVTGLIELQGDTGDLTTNLISLSTSIPIGITTGIFAGYGAVVLHTGERVYRIDLPSGLVSDLGPMAAFPHAYCENWAYWGVAEYFGGALHLDYVLDAQTIVRRRVPDGFTTNLATFTYLSDMCCFSVSALRSRWYFHHEGGSQFGGASEAVGYAAASFDRPPQFNPAVITNQIIYEDTATEPISFGILDNETPVNLLIMAGKSSNPLLLPETNIVFSGTNITRTFSLTPAPNQFGTSVVTLTVFDNIGLSTNKTFTLIVLPLNDPPSFAKGVDVSVLEDSGSFSLSNWAAAIIAGPLNEADQSLTFLATNDNPSLFITPPAVTPDGTLLFTPAADANGSALVTLRLQDNGGIVGGGQDISPPQTFRVTVQSVNDRPQANSQTVTGAEDTPLAITLGGSDIEGDALSFSISSPPAHGTLTGAGANRSYRPATNFFGDDSFSFKASDGQLESLAATVTIHITPVNDAPVAIPQLLTNLEDAPLAITLAGSDVEGDVLTFSIVAPPAHGSLTGIGANRSYRPVTNFFGDDSFSFKASDGQSESLAATVAIHITPVNDAPIAIPQSLTNREDAPLAITLAGSDVEGDVLTFSIVAPPGHGTLTGSGASRSYQPAADYFGLDSFSFKASDGQSESAIAVISITILAVNDPPGFTKGPNQSVSWDAGTRTVQHWATNIRPGPSNEAGQALEFQLVNDQPALFLVPPGIAPDGTLTYASASNAIGVATITVRLKDNGGTADGGQDTSAAQTFLITVLQVNQPPVPLIRISPVVMLTPDSTNAVVLSANNSNALVILDGSGSRDPENDPLGFAWFEGTNAAPFAGTMVASNLFNLGNHSIRLVVNDGRNSGTSTSSVLVISTPEALGELMQFISRSGLAQNRQRPLLATLEAAVTSFERGSFNSGINQLRAFQNKLRAQIAPQDPALADILTHGAQIIIDAARPSPRLQAHLMPPKGRLELTLTGEAGATYVIQTSTNLIQWTTFTNIVSVTGTNQFTEGVGPTRRFYRAFSP